MGQIILVVTTRSVTFYLCLKSITLRGTFLNMGELGAKKYFKDHQRANTVQLFMAIKGIFSGLLDKCSHLFICISSKQTLSSGQNPI